MTKRRPTWFSAVYLPALLLVASLCVVRGNDGGSSDITSSSTTSSSSSSSAGEGEGVSEDEKPIPVSELNVYQRLAAFLIKNNGTVDMEIEAIPGKGRGAVAKRDMAKGQVAVKLPRGLTVPLLRWNKSSEAHATALLKMRSQHPRFNEVFKPYWDTLPPPEYLLTKEYYPESAFDDLQDKDMVAHILMHQAYNKEAYKGKHPEVTKSLYKDCGQHVSLDDFRQSTAVVASYAFTFLSDTGDEQIRILLPMADLANHENPGKSNLALMEAEDGHFYAYTTREVAKGEELTHTYSDAMTRNDHSLFHYGFVQDLETPLLVSLDTPTGDLYGTADFNETEAYAPGGSHVTEEELERLEERLQSFPTTLEQDKALLAGKRNWLGRKPKPLLGFKRLAVEFRYQRKRALTHYIGVLRQALAASKSSADTAAPEGAAAAGAEGEQKELEAEILKEEELLEAEAEAEDAEDFEELQLAAEEGVAEL